MSDDDIYYEDDDTFEVYTFDSDSYEPVRALESLDAAEDDDDPLATTFEGPALAVPVAAARRPGPRRRRTAAAIPSRPPSVWWSTVRTVIIVGLAAMMVSTIFSLWTRPTFFTDEFRAGLIQVQATQRVINIQPSPLPTETRQIRIGIVAGHTGPPLAEGLPEDPGAVCPDGLTERRINEAVAREAVTALRREGYAVDLLEEFDSRLEGYQANALISIHTNDCQDYGAAGSGYNAATAQRQALRGDDERLLACLLDQYGKTTGLPRHYGITYDMTEYHTFDEVAVDTPTAIIELGFMLNDRVILLNQQPLIAQGITNAIRCFLRPELYDSVSAQ